MRRRRVAIHQTSQFGISSPFVSQNPDPNSFNLARQQICQPVRSSSFSCLACIGAAVAFEVTLTKFLTI